MMTTLPAPTASAARAATTPSATTGSEASGDGAGFAAALELARDPASAAASGRREIDADAGTRECSTGDGGEDDVAADSDAPELSALLPGWPPAAGPGVLTPPSAVAVAVAVAVAAQSDAPDAAVPLEARGLSARPDAAPTERWARSRGELMAAPNAAESSAALSHLPAGSRAAATQAADASAAPTAAKNDTAAIAALAPNSTSAQVLPLGVAAGSAGFGSTVNAMSTQASPPTFEARLAAAIDSAAFAPALAHQVTWLAGEGVQQARIHLNPAEMGPLSVKIVLDGTQARIDFSADLAATRGAIEASLPTLAAALNDAGLTLAGGGVFDGQARHGTPRERAASPAQAESGAAGAPHAAKEGAGAPAPHAARGLVDLVA